MASTFGELAHAAEPTRSMVRLSPSFTAAGISEWSDTRGEPRCETLECVRKQIALDRTLRIKGDFGRFVGIVREYQADSLAGFAVDDEWAAAPPAQPIAWSSVSSIDMRVRDRSSGAGTGAAVGALVGALVSTSVAAMASAVPATFFGSRPNLAPYSIGGAVVGGLLGMAVGAGVTEHSTHWERLYVRR